MTAGSIQATFPPELEEVLALATKTGLLKRISKRSWYHDLLWDLWKYSGDGIEGMILLGMCSEEQMEELAKDEIIVRRPIFGSSPPFTPALTDFGRDMIRVVVHTTGSPSFERDQEVRRKLLKMMGAIEGIAPR